MAKKSSQVQVGPEVINSKDGSQRRLSTGGASPSNGTVKILPHYLRASAGSCHDFCKYGRKHEFDDEDKLPVLKGITVTPLGGNSSKKTTTKAMHRQGKPMTKPKLSSDARVEAPNTSIIKIQGGTVKPATHSPVMSGGIMKPAAHSPDMSGGIMKPATHSPVMSVDATNEGISTPDVKRKKPVVKHNTSDPRIHPRTKASSMSKMTPQQAKTFKKELSPANRINAAAKTVTGLKSKPGRVGSQSSDSLFPREQMGKEKSGTKKVDKNEISTLDQMKAKALPRISISVKPSITRVASLRARKYRVTRTTSLKNQAKARTGEPKQVNEEKVIEKTLYVIEPKSEIKSMEAPAGNEISSTIPSPSSSLSSSVPSSLASSSLHEEEDVESESMIEEENEYILEQDETGNQLEKLKDEFKKRLRRAVIVHPENDELGWKLKFRRGKIVELSPEKNGPRRLKFRRGRSYRENQNGRNDMLRKSLKQMELNDGDAKGPGSESEKVILRHQDDNEKKDAQVLLNNVIEETASKLVETRKSKVKALVGAFETVISLQDGKPSGTNTS
ncbi:hypothetical protein Scep_017133 [Stephania cephalantha]|uniref:Calmodulin-binding domain-containing protein n=1 Tax=Stephania cephalantha TaxID=152367 RepID=A0AAP0IPX0_9MAGN